MGAIGHRTQNFYYKPDDPPVCVLTTTSVGLCKGQGCTVCLKTTLHRLTESEGEKVNTAEGLNTWLSIRDQIFESSWSMCFLRYLQHWNDYKMKFTPVLMRHPITVCSLSVT